MGLKVACGLLAFNFNCPVWVVLFENTSRACLLLGSVLLSNKTASSVVSSGLRMIKDKSESDSS
jgi:hypothetical protein